MQTLDAGMVCPIVRGDHPMAKRMVGGSSPIGEGLDPTPLQLEDVEGLAVNLYNNLMPISGFAQWYPFGVGDWYQTDDESATFRFVIRETH